MACEPLLPAGVQVFERGWLSSNNILLTDEASATLIDSGYATHAPQTLALLDTALAGRALDRLVNTHLHSDHCGGNAALQAHYPALQTLIPPGLAHPVKHWDQTQLSYEPTGQTCPPFGTDGLLQPGSSHRWAATEWQVHAAPGHDPHSVILFAPEHRLLVSADALWENGFGVVFPELEGEPGFDEVAASLDLIERLHPHTIIPGHGRVFADTAGALQRARTRLESFVRSPEKHARYGAKVLLKFKLQEFGRIAQQDFVAWAQAVPYLRSLHQRHGANQTLPSWVQQLIDDLARSGALAQDGQVLEDVST
jgi:glyoxylase-like metal-dependent hydrolase (beta-lactamase superfamily II)